MLEFGKASRVAAVLVACTALAGCLGGGGGGGGAGGGGGGGGGGGLSLAAHDAAYDRVKGMIPTSDMPTTGTANFAGGVRADLNKGAATIGTLLGDIEMAVNFGAADKSQAISGEVTNIRGKIGEEDVSYDGKLTTADSRDKGLPNVLSNDLMEVPPIPGVPSVPPIRPGSVMVHFTGEMELGEAKGNAVLQTGGNFVGPGGQAIHGPAGGTWWGPGGPSEYTVGGTWFAERK